MSPPDLRREPSSARGLTPPRSESKEAARPEPEPDKTQFARMTHTFFLPASSRLLRLPPASSRWVASTRTQFSFSRASAGFLFGKSQPIQEKPAGSRLNEEDQFGWPVAHRLESRWQTQKPAGSRQNELVWQNSRFRLTFDQKRARKVFRSGAASAPVSLFDGNDLDGASTFTARHNQSCRRPCRNPI